MLKRLLFTIPLFFMLLTPAYGAVVCNAETATSGNPPANPMTLVATPDAGSNRVWIIISHIRDTDADNTTVTVSSSAGGTFTSYGVNAEAGGTDLFAQMFYSTDFADGSQTLSANYSTVPTQGYLSQFICTGVNTTSPWLGAATTTSNASTNSVSINVS